MRTLLTIAALVTSISAIAQSQVPNVFEDGTPASAAEVNENFEYVLENASGGGREADPAGKEGWLNVLAQGQSREYVLNGFIGSAEFAALAASYGINASRVAGVLDRPEDGIAAERRTQKAGDAEAIPALPMLALFLFSGLLGLFGVRRLSHQ